MPARPRPCPRSCQHPGGRPGWVAGQGCRVGPDCPRNPPERSPRRVAGAGAAEPAGTAPEPMIGSLTAEQRPVLDLPAEGVSIRPRPPGGCSPAPWVTIGATLPRFLQRPGRPAAVPSTVQMPEGAISDGNSDSNTSCSSLVAPTARMSVSGGPEVLIAGRHAAWWWTLRGAGYFVVPGISWPCAAGYCGRVSPVTVDGSGLATVCGAGDGPGERLWPVSGVFINCRGRAATAVGRCPNGNRLK